MIGALILVSALAFWTLLELANESVSGQIRWGRAVLIITAMIFGCICLGWLADMAVRHLWQWWVG